MTGIKFLLDTNIVIGLLKGNEVVIQLLERAACSLSECAVSQISRMELLSYPSLAPDEEDKINQFLSAITVLMIDQSIEQTTIKYRRKNQRDRVIDFLFYKINDSDPFDYHD